MSCESTNGNNFEDGALAIETDLGYITNFVVDPSDNIYFAETAYISGQGIQKIDGNNGRLSLFDQSLWRRLAMDNNGDILATTDCSILKITMAGNSQIVAGSTSCSGVEAGNYDYLYFASLSMKHKFVDVA